MDRKWNEPRNHRFWQAGDENTEGREVLGTTPDLDLIRSPGQAKLEDILIALCRVTSELVEVVEELDKK